jgi:hypothetical protein
MCGMTLWMVAYHLGIDRRVGEFANEVDSQDLHRLLFVAEVVTHAQVLQNIIHHIGDGDILCVSRTQHFEGDPSISSNPSKWKIGISELLAGKNDCGSV